MLDAGPRRPRGRRRRRRPGAGAAARERAQDHPDVPRQPARARRRHPGRPAVPLSRRVRHRLLRRAVDDRLPRRRELSTRRRARGRRGGRLRRRRPRPTWPGWPPAPPQPLRVRTGPEDRARRCRRPGSAELLAADLDNDGHLDLVGWGPERFEIWRAPATAASPRRPPSFGLARGRDRRRAAPRCSTTTSRAISTWRSPAARAARAPSSTATRSPDRSNRSAPIACRPSSWTEVRDLVASDLDRDGDLDLLVAHAGGLAWLDNLRQGRFAPREGGFEAGTAPTPWRRPTSTTTACPRWSPPAPA